MSKERARRRAEREREQAIKAAARAAEEERRKRREARRRRDDRLAYRGRAGSPACWRPAAAGRSARRSRSCSRSTSLVWVVRGDAAARVLALMVSLLVAPVVHIMLFGRR